MALHTYRLAYWKIYLSCNDELRVAIYQIAAHSGCWVLYSIVINETCLHLPPHVAK